MPKKVKCDAGSVVPAGQCPACGALAYLAATERGRGDNQHALEGLLPLIATPAGCGNQLVVRSADFTMGKGVSFKADPAAAEFIVRACNGYQATCERIEDIADRLSATYRNLVKSREERTRAEQERDEQNTSTGVVHDLLAACERLRAYLGTYVDDEFNGIAREEADMAAEEAMERARLAIAKAKGETP